MVKIKSIKFSIIIPAYNAAKFIERALDSVQKQSYHNYEVLIINDGSIDDTEQIIRQYVDKYPKFSINLFSQENKGAGGARNKGIGNANGDYIAFLDADDCWYLEKLEKICNFLIAHPDIDVLYHNEIEIRSDGKRRLLNYTKVNKHAYEDLLFSGNKLSTSATVVRREMAQSIRGFSENLDFNSAEDYDFWLRLAKAGAKFSHLPEFLGEYHRVNGSLTSNIEYNNRNYLNITKYHMELLDKEGKYSSDFLQKIYYRRKAMVLFVAGREFYLNGSFVDAIQYYLKTLKHRPFWWKPYAGLLQTFLRKFCI